MNGFFSLVWLVTLIAFIVYWRKKVGAKKNFGADSEEYKKISKTKRIIGIVCIIAFIGSSLTAPKKEHNPSDELPAPAVQTEQPAKTETKAPEPSKQEIPHRAEAKGVSDKSASDLNISYSKTFNNDVTGNWRLATFSKTGIDINEYLKSYTEKYYQDDKEVHIVINFGNNTTTVINKYGELLMVTTYEYKKGDEHDAKACPGGMSLGSAQIHLDNG